MLEVSELDVCYGDVQALWGVSLEVRGGEIVALVGANGAGKTTLLRSISGLLKPSAGGITFSGERVESLPAHQIVQMGVSHVPEGRSVFPLMTVLENLELGSYPPEARKARKESLEWVFDVFPILKERQKQLAGTLSGGEQQMLAIGRGLMSRPKLMLLDEPSLGLAPILVEEIFQTISEINEEGVTILLVEQNIQHALNLASRGYVLENGRITMAGEGRDLLKDDYMRRAYLGM